MSDNPKVRISNPACRHAAQGFVSWPPIQQITPAVPHASTYCCDREACVTDAAQWVEAHVGHVGVFQSFNEVRS